MKISLRKNGVFLSFLALLSTPLYLLSSHHPFLPQDSILVWEGVTGVGVGEGREFKRLRATHQEK